MTEKTFDFLALAIFTYNCTIIVRIKLLITKNRSHKIKQDIYHLFISNIVI